MPFHSSGDLLDPGTEPWSSAFQADSLPSVPPGKGRQKLFDVLLMRVPSKAATAKSLQSCLILCDPIDSSPPGSPVQARTLEWVAIAFSNDQPRQHIINLDNILKSKDITLATKVHLVKAMVFPVVMYGCESSTIKKTEH